MMGEMRYCTWPVRLRPDLSALPCGEQITGPLRTWCDRHHKEAAAPDQGSARPCHHPATVSST